MLKQIWIEDHTKEYGGNFDWIPGVFTGDPTRLRYRGVSILVAEVEDSVGFTIALDGDVTYPGWRPFPEDHVWPADQVSGALGLVRDWIDEVTPELIRRRIDQDIEAGLAQEDAVIEA